jgi:hypothetical protein
LIGYWKLTSPDPSGVGESDGISIRKLARTVVLISAALAIVLQFARFDILFFWGVFGVATVATIVERLAMFSYARALLLRIPADRLAWQCRILMWSWVANELFGSISFAYLRATGRPPSDSNFFLISMVGVLFMVLIMIWTLAILLVSTLALNRTAREARRNWATNIE